MRSNLADGTSDRSHMAINRVFSVLQFLQRFTPLQRLTDPPR